MELNGGKNVSHVKNTKLIPLRITERQAYE